MKADIGIKIDIEELVRSRLLVQANSGGGKSYAIRKLLEGSHGKVQQIVLDIEGEFSSLREKYDYVLIGKGHDININLRHVDILCRKLLEDNISAIIDLYELEKHERMMFVKKFLDALINSPKSLWHEVLVVIDEAHQFCPQSTKAESMSSVIDLCTRGRKRGFCAVLATQRISKLHKDAAAECNNKLIGRTGLDVDMKRAADELGFTTKEDILSLRELKPGEFYGFGPAIANRVTKFKISQVSTQHVFGVGRKAAEPPKPSVFIKNVLAKLSDLPEEAEKELISLDAYKKHVNILEKQNQELRESSGEAFAAKKYEKQIQELKDDYSNLTKWAKDLIKKTIDECEQNLKGYFEAEKQHYEQIKFLLPLTEPMTLPNLLQTLQRLEELISAGPMKIEFKKPVTEIKVDGKYTDIKTPVGTLTLTNNPDLTALGKRYKNDKDRYIRRADFENKSPFLERNNLGKCPLAILKFLAMRRGKEYSYTQVGAMTGYAGSSGNFSNAVGVLVKIGYVARNSGRIKLSDSVSESVLIEILGDEYYSNNITSLETWLDKFGKTPRNIYNVLIENKETEYTVMELGKITGYSGGSGNFSNAIGKLVTLGLAERNNGIIRFNRELINI